MKDKKINLQISNPDKLVYSEKVDSIILPAQDGEMGVLPGHISLIGALSAGVVNVLGNAERKYFAVKGGYFEISEDSVKILADDAVNGTDVKTEEASALKDAVEKDIAEKMKRYEDTDELAKELKFILAELKALSCSGQ